MSTYEHFHTSQASVPTNTHQERFALEGMDDFYITFKEKCTIHAESFNAASAYIYHKIGMCGWSPFTIPIDPCILELVWEFYASCRARQQLMKQEGRTEAFPHLTSVWVRGQEVHVMPEAINSLDWDEPIPPHPFLHHKVEEKVHQFQWVASVIAQGQPQWAVFKGLIHQRDLKFDPNMWLDFVFSRLIPSQNTLEVPIEVAILLSCMMEHVHINVGKIIADQSRQKAKQQATKFPFPTLINRQRGPNDKAGKVYKEHEPTITLGIFSHSYYPNADDSQNSPPPELLNIAQRAKMHENQLLRLAKAIPTMIQSAFKKALLTVKDNLTHLCSKVDVLESGATTCRSTQKSPDDWWVGDHSDSDIISNEENAYHNPPLPPPMHSVYDVNPSWAPGEWQQHLTMSFEPFRTDGHIRPWSTCHTRPDPMQPTS
ncbi:hypothetical protein HAX54_008222 [Datura stramonium]|uniref:Putative plant transposon protein domain-containing protein n=1 Tax=Datura stramonium TaxID=4076 RepID=A0ABS8TEQ2_DATST|nr:hypothetical protein [Datura stramonium]